MAYHLCVYQDIRMHPSDFAQNCAGCRGEAPSPELQLVRAESRLTGWAGLSQDVHEARIETHEPSMMYRYCNDMCFRQDVAMLQIRHGWRHLFPHPAHPVATCSYCGAMVFRTHSHLAWLLLPANAPVAEHYDLGRAESPLLVAITCLSPECMQQHALLWSYAESGISLQVP